MIPLIRVILLIPVVVVVVGHAAVEVLVVELISLAAVAVEGFVRLVRLTVGAEDWSRREELRL